MADIGSTYGPQRDLLGSSVLADVLDALGHRQAALPATLRPLRPEWKLFGPAATSCHGRGQPASAVAFPCWL